MNDKYSTNPDTFRRWMKIGSLLEGKNLSILDVGGDPNNNAIKLFIPHRITAVNPQYNNISGTSLPFDDESFDITISIDTLEHIPNIEREKFIKELIRTSKLKAILACPFDDPLVSEMEKAIYAVTKHPFLEEHIRNGLPNLRQTLSLIETMGLSYKIYNNDPLIAWASWILLHQTNMGRFNLRTVNYLLNQAYDIQEGHEISYRKVIEIFKETNKKLVGTSSTAKNPSLTTNNGQQEVISVTTANTTLRKEKASHSIDINKKEMASIVIPTITRKYLDTCIESIENNTSSSNYEIIIVNDGSSEPEFMEYLAKTKHRVLNLPNNVGFAKANNEGFKVAKGNYIITLNADTIVRKDWLSTMINTLQSDENIAIVGPTVLYTGTSIIQEAGCFLDNNSNRNFIHFLNGKQIQDYPQTNTTYRVDAVGGVCMLFRRRILFEVGLFDENYVNGWEDMDICLSIRYKGYKIYHAPSVIEHYGSFVRKESPKLLEWTRKNGEYFFSKLRKQAIDFFSMANEFAQKCQYNEAIKHYLMAIEADKFIVSAYYNLAIIYHSINQKDAAIKYFEKVAELEPRNASVYNYLGVLFFSKGLFEEAEYHFNKAIALDNKEAVQNFEIMRFKRLYAPKEG